MLIEIIVFGFIIPGGIMADTVMLRNGRTINGILEGQTQRQIQINVDGRLMIILKNKIRRINYGETIKEKAKRRKLEERIRQAGKRRERMRSKNIARTKINVAILNLE